MNVERIEPAQDNSNELILCGNVQLRIIIPEKQLCFFGLDISFHSKM
jgi:hypothetical protein